MSRKLVDDCFVTDGRRLSHGEALAILRDRIRPVAPIGRRALSEVNGCVLAEDAVARQPVPSHTNAAVDGYAFANRDCDPKTGGTLTVSARVTAGHALSGPVIPGTAVRIFTGAVLPEGVDTVVMQEDVSVTTQGGVERVEIPGGLKTGANVRKAGEDVKQNEVLLSPGHIIRPQDLAALASIGLADVACHEPLSVAILSSGDEIVRAGSGALAPGQVYDANAPMLAALVAAAGARATGLGIVPDRPEAVRVALGEASRRHQVILTTGGASRGEEDHMVAALEALGKRHLWQLAIKPGRPMSFGQIGDCVVVGLPGNPVAVFVCFLMYVWPMLRRLGGAPFPEPRRLRLPAVFEFTGRKPGRREFWRGMLVERDGTLAVDKFKRDGSGLISGLRAADGLIDIPETHGDVRQGELVDFIPFSEFGILGR